MRGIISAYRGGIASQSVTSAGIGGSAIWQQDVRWPVGWISPREAFALRDRGALPESLLRASWEEWCREPQPGEQWQEIEEK